MNLHLATALVYASLAWAIWWWAMPPMIVKRGRLQGLRSCLLGMAMACFVSGKLELSMADAPIRWAFAAGDLCLIGYGLAHVFRARSLGPFTWHRCPHEVENG